MELLLASNFQMYFVFFIVIVALAFYATEYLSIEITSLSVLASLLVFFYFFPVYDINGKNIVSTQSIFNGLANPALITIVSLMIIGDAIARTGSIETLSGFFAKKLGGNAYICMFLFLFFVALVSGFLNNVPVVVIFIPLIQQFAKKVKTSQVKWLMPLSFMAILGGMTTLVGSSTNLLVSGALVETGLPPLDFFSFSLLGLLLLLVGSVYVIGVLPFILPDRKGKPLYSELKRTFYSKVTIDSNSPLCGKTIQNGIVEGIDCTVHRFNRGNLSVRTNITDIKIIEGDRLLLSADKDNLLKIASYNVKNYVSNGNSVENDENNYISSQIMSEVMVAPNSHLIGKTLSEYCFNKLYNCLVVAIERKSGFLRRDLQNVKMCSGDVLLIQGREEDINEFKGNPDVVLLEWSREDVKHRYTAITALSIFAITMISSMSGLMETSIAMFVGSLAMIIFKCISFERALDAPDHRVILLIMTSLAIGHAITATGGDGFIAKLMYNNTIGFEPEIVLSIFFLIVMVVTNIVSNQATAVLFTPIAVSMANSLGVDPYAFVFAVVFASNCSFVTPIAYQTNLLVMSPGQYSFGDFVKYGLPLSLLIWVTYSIAAPLYFGF